MLRKVFFHTFGCRTNQYETNVVREEFLNAGYISVKSFLDCDICVINSCSVTQEADRKCRQMVRRVLRENLHAQVIVTGCSVTYDASAVKDLSDRVSIFTNERKKDIFSVVTGCTLDVKHTILLSQFGERTRAFVKIQDGCDATCTYCIIPKLRPKMESREIEHVVQECTQLIQKGYKEIVLTGIRLGSYGLENTKLRRKTQDFTHNSFVQLLKRIIDISGNFRIRLSSLEITEVTDDLLDLIVNSTKICHHLHLPIQSGDDAILKKMGRWYNLDAYLKTIKKIRSMLDDVCITTDVIVGFPGETDEHFDRTYQVLKQYFHGLHVFPYSERKGVSSIKLKDTCSKSTIGRRVRVLLDLDKQCREKFYKRFQGTFRQVVSETQGGFTDNGIRISELSLSPGQMESVCIPHFE